MIVEQRSRDAIRTDNGKQLLLGSVRRGEETRPQSRYGNDGFADRTFQIAHFVVVLALDQKQVEEE
jgi:hypothetical protein